MEVRTICFLSSLIIATATLINGAQSTPVQNDRDDANLYSDKGLVLNLEHDNFYIHLSNSDKSWIVLFYLSWCGHCIDYVPVYKSVAHNLNGWSDYLGVSAINCAKEANHDICRDHNVTAYPSLKFVPVHTQQTQTIAALDQTVTSSNSSLIQFALSKMKELHPGATLRNVVTVAGKQNAVGGDKSTTLARTTDIIVTSQNSSVLFFEDLVYALRYSLDTEVGGHQVIQGESLLALRDYLLMLHKYFPDDDQTIHDSISKLYTLVGDNPTQPISNELWTSHLLESGLLKSTESKAKLIRCKGSQSMYRGYPCSLWSLFHVLTVQSVNPEPEEDKHLKDQRPCYRTLTSIRGYIRHFFTCADCRENFAKMAVEIDGLSDKTNKDCVLWLWSAHNKANKRLAGELSEDPAYPKIQFPSAELCPYCRSPKGMWLEDVVYELLHSVYTDIRHSQSHNLMELRVIPIMHRQKHVVDSRATGIGSLELSMCYFIYLLCGGVIACLFYFVVVRQRLYLRARKCPKVNTDRYSITSANFHKPIY